MIHEPTTLLGKRFYHHVRAELFNECYCMWAPSRMYSVKSHQHGQQALWCLSEAVAKCNKKSWRDMLTLVEEMLSLVGKGREYDFVNSMRDYLIKHPPPEADWDVRPNRVGLDFIG